MKRLALVLAALTDLMCCASAAESDGITFTETAIASGSLDEIAFTDALVTLTMTVDTSTIRSPSPGFFTAFLTGFVPATVSVAGVGSDTFVVGVDVFLYQPESAAGFLDTGDIAADIPDTLNEAFDNYALSTTIGPLSGKALINPFLPFETTLGTFDITSVSGDATFTAMVSTPEPSTLILFGTGFLGLLGIWKYSRA
jgi:hypothetical protein